MTYEKISEKKIRYRKDILNNIGCDEHVVNLFKISKKEQKIKKSINGKNANITHYTVEKNIREVLNIICKEYLLR